MAAAAGRRLAGAGCSCADCDARFLKSPQSRAQGCEFQNPPNPDAKPHRSSWDIWSRFLLARKEGTVPLDEVPVRKLDRAALAAMDPAANHIVRLGHSSHLLKLRGQLWLIDPVFGERVSPFSWLDPRRFHAPPLALQDLPAIAKAWCCRTTTTTTSMCRRSPR